MCNVHVEAKSDKKDYEIEVLEMKTYLVTFFKNRITWETVMHCSDVATEIWLNNNLPGMPLDVKEI